MIPQHQTYETIIKLVNTEKLKEPFYPIDIATATGEKNNDVYLNYIQSSSYL